MTATDVGTCVYARSSLPVKFLDELHQILNRETPDLRIDAPLLAEKDLDLIVEDVVPGSPRSEIEGKIYEAAGRYGLDLTRIEVAVSSSRDYWE